MTADRPGHPAFDELAVGWALHALEPEDESLFVAHLPGCDALRDDGGRDAEVMAAMATDLPAVRALRGAPRPDPRRGRADRAAARGDPQPGRPRGSRARRTVRPIPSCAGPRPDARAALPLAPGGAPGLVAAGVAAIVGLGIWNIDLATDRSSCRRPSRSRARW